MADSQRLKILKALTSHLEQVTTGTGYNYTLTNQVFRGRAGYGDETDMPWVGIFELRPEEVYMAGETFSKDDWFIGVQGWVPADEKHPTDPAHALMQDVKKRLARVIAGGSPHNRNPDYMLPDETGRPMVSRFQMDGGMTFVAKENPSNAAFALRLTVTIAEDLENP
jgi:hypothetical protein